MRKRVLAIFVILAAIVPTLYAVTITQPITGLTGWDKWGASAAVYDGNGLSGAESSYGAMKTADPNGPVWITVREDKAIQLIRPRGLLTSAVAIAELWGFSAGGLSACAVTWAENSR